MQRVVNYISRTIAALLRILNFLPIQPQISVLSISFRRQGSPHRFLQWNRTSQHGDHYVICSALRGVVLTKNPEVYHQLKINLVSDLILYKKLTKI